MHALREFNIHIYVGILTVSVQSLYAAVDNLGTPPE